MTKEELDDIRAAFERDYDPYFWCKLGKDEPSDPFRLAITHVGQLLELIRDRGYEPTHEPLEQLKNDASRSALFNIYIKDNASYFREVRAGTTAIEKEPGAYSGFRAWLDGYKAANAAKSGVVVHRPVSPQWSFDAFTIEESGEWVLTMVGPEMQAASFTVSGDSVRAEVLRQFKAFDENDGACDDFTAGGVDYPCTKCGRSKRQHAQRT